MRNCLILHTITVHDFCMGVPELILEKLSTMQQTPSSSTVLFCLFEILDLPNLHTNTCNLCQPAFQNWDKSVGSIDQTPSPPKYKEGVWGRD